MNHENPASGRGAVDGGAFGFAAAAAPDAGSEPHAEWSPFADGTPGRVPQSPTSPAAPQAGATARASVPSPPPAFPGPPGSVPPSPVRPVSVPPGTSPEATLPGLHPVSPQRPTPPVPHPSPYTPPASAGPPPEPLSRPSLIPGPEETTLLPPILDEETPAPAGFGSEARKKQSVKRHRGDSPLTGSERARRVVRGAGEVLITFGVIVMLYALYEIYGVSAEINAAQEDMAADLDVLWGQEDDGGTPVPELGDAFARMWAPDIREQSWILVEGTELSDIEYAPGRFLEGAYPGEQGNFTLAGHNVPAIFQKIRDLKPGDKVVIETKDHFYVYEVQYSEVVADTQLDVTAPVPRNPGTTPGPDDYWMTLFTCHPLWDNYERYVVYHKLIDTYERDPAGELPDEAINPGA